MVLIILYKFTAGKRSTGVYPHGVLTGGTNLICFLPDILFVQILDPSFLFFVFLSSSIHIIHAAFIHWCGF